MESDPLEELWDVGRSKTIKAGVKQTDMRPLFTQDPAKGKSIVSYSEATAQSNNGPHLYLVCRSNARLPWEKLPFIKMKMIITPRASPSFQPPSYSELITYASVWIMHGAIDVS